MLISSLNRKLLRDLGTLRGQILTIALVFLDEEGRAVERLINSADN